MGSSTAPQAYTPPDQAGAASGLSSAASSLSALGGTTTGTAVPGYQQIYSAVQNNPYYAGAQAAANQTGATGTAFGNQEVQTGTGLQNLATSLGQYAPGIAATAFDPQGQLYNQQQGQNLAQTNAINAQNGVAGSPYGAGLGALSNQNFNMNWLNNQQTREDAGVAALSSLANTQSGLATAGGNLGTSGLNNLTTAGNASNAAYNQQQTYIDNALNSLVQGDVAAGSPYSSAASADTSYLGIGQQAAATNVSAYNAQQQADNSFWGGIGSLGGEVAGAFIGI
jgi:hypothetical protein